jgi:hypothetical protein
MAFDKFVGLETLTKERRAAIAKSIRSITTEELKQIGEKLFPHAGDAWRDAFFQFVAENPSGTYHHAVTHDGVNLLYCREKDKGIWFLPGRGLGPLQAIGRKAMKELSGAAPIKAA